MKSYLKGIILFNKDGSKRAVPLKEGVNIITGESKTGKSALVEKLTTVCAVQDVLYQKE